MDGGLAELPLWRQDWQKPILEITRTLREFATLIGLRKENLIGLQEDPRPNHIICGEVLPVCVQVEGAPISKPPQFLPVRTISIANSLRPGPEPKL